MLGNLTGWHLLVIVLIVLLLFGATKLPALARGVGESMKIFRSELKSESTGDDAAAAPAATAPARPAADQS